ncbi:MAG: PDZ domain-containing protein [Ignavibacteriales bacterium]|nr:PDZ domain-containing protein [Ignavibacteriales bacterium]
MKTTIQMIWCLAIVLFLSIGTILSAGGKLTGETHKKEKTKSTGWIGVTIQDVNEKTAQKAKLDSAEGVLVKDVIKDSPADSAGIQEGDIVVEYNGKKLFDADELVKIVHRTLPGTKVDIVIIRDSQKKTLTLTVGSEKVSKHQMFGGMPNIPDMRVFFGNNILGLQLLTLNEQLGGYFGVPNNEGVLVEKVERESTAEKAGFKAGDIIIRIGTKTIDAVEKVQRELRKYDEGDKVDFEVMRKGVKKVLSVEMEEDQIVPHKFFFQKPHMRMFRTDPCDEAEMHLDMDDLRPHLDQVQIDLRESLKDINKIPLRFRNMNCGCYYHCLDL